MLTGKPDAGNLHGRFDAGEWQDWHVYVAGCRSLLYCENSGVLVFEHCARNGALKIASSTSNAPFAKCLSYNRFHEKVI